MRTASKQLTFTLWCFLAIGFSQTTPSMEIDLGEFADHKYDTPVSTEGAQRAPVAKVESNEVVYGQSGDQVHRGYLSRPVARDTASGLIVIHEWWGLSEDIHAMTEQLAAQGYTALAVDLYDGQSATQVRAAYELSTSLSSNEERGLANLKAAYDYLETEMGATKIGVIGWCLGGKWSLKTALMLPGEIDATVIYYGSLTDDKDKLATLDMPIIGFVGTKDRLHKEFVAFDANMKELGKNASIHIYEGAKHAFANASGIVYEPVAAEDSWEKTVSFLKAHLSVVTEYSHAN
ncbi:MAG: dienelactone hydrolase family protein [Dehalococcoidia bacterium]|nr:dienelactone hydrolase family protein [Dehalococcoidia bacterium]